MNWSQEEINTLIEVYSDMASLTISENMNRSLYSIKSMANKLRLKKSKKYKSNFLSKRNKLLGRDLSFDFLSEIALKYNSRSEFQKMDPSAYFSARKMKILNTICSHMIKKSFSIPQMILYEICMQIFDSKIRYNDRKIIKPYELDIFIDEYKLALEYNSKYWHLNDKIDKNYLCKSKDILLIQITETNRDYESDIKDQLINIV
jgi:hypothetical protein